MTNKENNFNYSMKGSITRYGTNKFNTDEQSIVNYYAEEGTLGPDLGYIQDVDEMIRNANDYLKTIEDNFYNCLYDSSALEELHKRLRNVEQEMFRIANVI